jgi:DNA-binding transcriptional MerR regulator
MVDTQSGTVPGGDWLPAARGGAESLPRRIKDVSELLNISASTIKFYEAKGLLKPRRSGGQRVYGPQDYTRLAFILRLKAFDFSIGEIQAILAEAKGDGADELESALTLDICRGKIDRLKSEATKISEIVAMLEAYCAEKFDR